MRASIDGPNPEAVCVRLGSFRATIDVPEPLRAEVRSAFRDYVVSSPGGVMVEIRVDHGGAQLSVDGRKWAPGPNQTPVDQLAYMFLKVSAESSPDHVHLHAGLTAHNGAGVVVAGPSGCGKSTLIVDLIRAGFAYGSDERISIDRSGRVTALDRPVSITAGSFDALRKYDPLRTGIGSASGRIWHLPAESIRPGSIQPISTVRLITLVEYDPGIKFVVTEIDPAEATRRLLEECVASTAPSGATLERVAHLCASSTCVQIKFSDPRSVIQWIKSAVEEPPQRRSVERLVQPLHLEGSTSVVRFSPGVEIVRIGHNCLAMDRNDGRLIEFDQATSFWLSLFDGKVETAELVSEAATANGMTEESVWESVHNVLNVLRTAGVLSPVG